MSIVGIPGTVRIAIRATIFGAWAVHQSHDVDNGGENAIHHGYVVTHVGTGLTFPPSVVNGLSEAQAVAIARTLATEIDAAQFDAPRPSRAAQLHACRIIERVLAEESS